MKKRLNHRVHGVHRVLKKLFRNNKSLNSVISVPRSWFVASGRVTSVVNEVFHAFC